MLVALWLAASVTTVCLEPDGSLSPVVCAAPATRLDARREVCECPTGRRTDAPLCTEGEKPPPRPAPSTPSAGRRGRTEAWWATASGTGRCA